MTARARPAHPIHFVDLAAQHGELRDELEAAYRDVVTSSAFIGGAAVAAFESQWAEASAIPHAIGVANGTDALELAFAALGIGAGDEVIVPTNTYVATAEAVAAVGAVPVFVDVDPATRLLTAEIAADAVTSRTAAIVAVHLYGQMADVEALAALAERHDLALVEDAAQAHGARFAGFAPGALGHVATYSFYPGKNLGALGDAGAVTTRDPGLAERVRMLANHGCRDDRYRHHVPGRNSRLDGLQAAFLSVKLTALERWNDRRRAVHARYAARLGGDPRIGLLTIDPRACAVHHLEPVLVPARDAVARSLGAAGIATGVHYPICCHHQEAFADRSPGALPVSEHAAAHQLSLPIHPHLDDDDVDRVAAALVAALDALDTADAIDPLDAVDRAG
jgi:dTDP-4-amino-4,6-dideoxygalactose transaminase